MSTTTYRRTLRGLVALGATMAMAFGATALGARQARPAPAVMQKSAQPNDAEYTRKILDNTPDARMKIELVDHLPASATVPTPLKVLGYIPGENGNLTYSADVYKYLDQLDAASPRVTCWSIGKTEEGRDTRSCAVADEATIKSLDKYKQITAQLTDPRKTTDAQAKTLIATGKPIYWATGSIHSGETGSVEMLMELGYRLAVEETPFIQTIRNNIITVFTPTTEVDGHDRQVDNQRAQRAGVPSPSMVYWGKYVAHDNNRDGIGKGLALTQNVLRSFLDLHPQVLHDLHESVNLLYTSTGTGPYNAIVDPIQVSEWWLLAQHEILELTKRGVPGVWTYNYYDGWVPNYMFWIGVSHNAIGRFYETQSGSGTVSTPGAQSREWYRPNPNMGDVKWNMRSNVNMQQSALLLSLNNVARNKEQFLDNYWMKMKNAVEGGKSTAPHAYVIPAGQRGKGAVAKLVNLIRNEGADVSVASQAFKAGTVDVAAGDYVVRMDQPYRGIVEMYLGVQWYPADNPRPYDDTGWSIPLLHNVTVKRVDDNSILSQAMTTLTADAKAPGSITGTGSTIIVDHTTDTSLMTFRVKNAAVKMSAAEQAFEVGGHKFAPGAFVIQGANRATIEASIREHGLQAWAVDALPTTVTMHDLDLPRVGYIHSWQNTQEEGWTRMGLDKMGVPYTYFGDNEVRKGNLRQRFDVILYPGAGVQIDGGEMPTGGTPQPYKKSDVTPNVGTPDQTDDRRGGLGRDGFAELQKFVQEGGVLITEGQTTQALVDYNIAPGVSVVDTPGTYVPGSVMKTLLGDKSNPVLYGYDQTALAVLIKNGPALQVAGGGGGRGAGGRGGLPEGVGGGNLQPMAAPPQLTTLDGSPAPTPMGAMPARGGGAGAGRGAGPAGARGGGARGGGAPGGLGAAATVAVPGPRVLLAYPNDATDLLLSGELVGGENLTGKAVLVDAPLGKGHIVMFANRPFWRNEPHGNYFLWFNAMLNWNDLK
jgi:hypothetical protein